MSAGHNHGPARVGSRHRSRLSVVLVMVVVVMVVELVTGVLTNSLALLSDAGHMATDALGLAMALAAIVAADHAESARHRTFGLYRLEILAALANAALLFGVAGYVLWEAAMRLAEPADVASGPMLAAAVLGMAVNVLGWLMLRRGAEESINVEGAMLEVVADLWGSVGVIVAALVVRFAGWPYADPLVGAAIGLFILPRAYRLGRRALRILVEAAPEHVDLESLETRLRSIDGVSDVHDLHVWTLTSEMDVATMHLMTPPNADAHSILDQARDLLERSYGIAHATVQVEPDTHEGCREMTW